MAFECAVLYDALCAVDNLHCLNFATPIATPVSSDKKIRGNAQWPEQEPGMAILCHSSQIMLTEYPPAPASNTVPLPVLSTPTHRPACRGRSICWRTTSSMPR
jgi:hypothetical protein